MFSMENLQKMENSYELTKVKTIRKFLIVWKDWRKSEKIKKSECNILRFLKVLLFSFTNLCDL